MKKDGKYNIITIKLFCYEVFQDKDKRMIPVIAMTANVFEEDKEKAYKSGMNGHLSKPIDMALLISTLNKCLHL